MSETTKTFEVSMTLLENYFLKWTLASLAM